MEALTLIRVRVRLPNYLKPNLNPNPNPDPSLNPNGSALILTR